MERLFGEWLTKISEIIGQKWQPEFVGFTYDS